MVVLRGNVRDAKKSTESQDVYISGAVLTQGSGWSVVTNESGYFYTSANVILDLLSVNADGYKNSTISIPKFATRYDGSVVISGSLTHNVSVYGGLSYITDSVKSFTPDTLSGRILTMMNGVDDGKTGVILGNTANIVTVGGPVGGHDTFDLVISNPDPDNPREMFATTVGYNGDIIVAGGATDRMSYTYSRDVWRSQTNGSSWVCMTSNAAFGDRCGGKLIMIPHNEMFTPVLYWLGGDLIDDNGHYSDVWTSLNLGASWSQNITSGCPAFVNNRNGYSVTNGMGSNFDGPTALIIGGADFGGCKNDVWEFVQTHTITCKTSNAPWSAREYHGSVTTEDGDIFVIGGQCMYTQLNDVWRSPDYGISWTCMTSNAEWIPRHGMGVACLSGCIYIFGGSPSTDNVDWQQDVWKSDTDGATWTCVMSNTVWAGDFNNMAGATLSSTIVVVNQEMSGAVWKYSPAGGGGGDTIITASASGDVYNIGGVSSEPTDHIIVTMWDNSSYDGGEN
jgi:hypothetical protein